MRLSKCKSTSLFVLLIIVALLSLIGTNVVLKDLSKISILENLSTGNQSINRFSLNDRHMSCVYCS